MSQEKAEKILQQQKEQTRTNTEPTTSDEPSSLEDSIKDAYAAIDEGDANTNITVRDTNLAALFTGLEDADELEGISRDAEDALGRDAENVSQSRTLGLLARIGLQEISPETLDVASESRDEYIVNSQDDF